MCVVSLLIVIDPPPLTQHTTRSGGTPRSADTHTDTGYWASHNWLELDAPPQKKRKGRVKGKNNWLRQANLLRPRVRDAMDQVIKSVFNTVAGTRRSPSTDCR